MNNTLKHASKLMDLPPYIAFTYQHDFYVTLTDNDLLNCIHNTVLSCNFNMALTPSNIPQCTVALFNNNISQVYILQFQIFTKPFELLPTSVVVYQTNTLNANV